MLTKKIFIDLETLPPEIDLEDFRANLKAPSNYKKEEAIEKWINENWEEKYKKLAVDTNQANICSIGVAVDDQDPIVFLSEKRNEKSIILDFHEYLIEELNRDIADELEVDINQNFITWIGFNNKKFDMDLLWKRSLNFGFYELCKLIPRERYSKNIFDIMEVWNPFDFNKFISQDEVCKFLNIEGKPEGIDGSMIYDLWHKKEFQKIIDYNVDDVEKVRKLYKIISKASN
jgi:uncharacterized protein YprB with RNaseH-like and TPR domain